MEVDICHRKAMHMSHSIPAQDRDFLDFSVSLTQIYEIEWRLNKTNTTIPESRFSKISSLATVGI